MATSDATIDRLRRKVLLSETASRYGVELQNDGNEWVACCPFHAEDTPSFTIFTGRDHVQRFQCFGCDAAGDVLDFVKDIKGVDLKEAIRILGGAVSGPNVAPIAKPARNVYAGIVPLDPPSVIKVGNKVRLYNPKRAGHEWEWGTFKPSAVYPYRRDDGAVMGYVLRREMADGGKETPMVMWGRLPDGSECWSRFPFAKPRPLYGFERDCEGQVLLVEGEKCRDALAGQTRRNVATWPGGTNGVNHVDWSPLAGRDVVIWPDADVAGLATANEIAAILQKLGVRPRILDIKLGEHPKGWDCADAIGSGWSMEDVWKFMRDRVRAWSPPAVPADDPPKLERKPSSSTPVPQAKAMRQAHPQESSEHSVGQAPIKAIQLQVPANDPIAVKVPQHTPRGAEGASRIPRILEVPHGSEVEVARIFAERLSSACGGKVVKADGAFWAFGPTDWKEIPEQKLRLAVHRFDGATIIAGRNTMLKIGKRMIDGILFEAGMILAEPGFFDDTTLAVNALNGTIAVEKDGRIVVRSHDPDDRFRFTVDAEFHLHTEMDPPPGSLLHKLIFGAFRDDHDAGDKVKLVGEILGAAAFGLATRLPQPKAFVFLGETASNGKSTIAGLLSCLLPTGSVSSISPAAFGDERRIINLAGKAANVADELSAAAISGETFKAAITGNTIEGRDLYKSAVTFKPRALHCFTTNTLPRFSGGLDRGLQRRLVVLRFNRPIPEKEIMPDILDRIQRDELDLLLGFAIAGAQRLFRKQAYTIPASSAAALKDWLLLDPVNEWFAERIVSATEKPSNGWPRSIDLYEDFKLWARDNGHSERYLPPVNTFGQRLKAMPGVELRRNDGARAYWIALKTATELSSW